MKPWSVRAVTTVAVTAALFEVPDCTAGDRCGDRLVVESAVEATGHTGVVRVERDDGVRLPIATPAVDRFAYFEVREGGWQQLDSGQYAFAMTTSHRRWRLVMNCDDGQLFRLFGFGGSDFSALMSRLAHKVNRYEAIGLAEFYVGTAWAQDAAVTRNLFELRRFAEGILYGAAVEPRQCTRAVERWLHKADRDLRSIIVEPQSAEASSGWSVRLAAAMRRWKPTLTVTQPRIEVRQLEIAVGETGEIDVLEDRLVSELEVLE